MEQSWSRFRKDSELSRLNRDGFLDSPSEFFRIAIEAAITANDDTRGLFEPRVLSALEAIGYDRSFEKIIPVTSIRTPAIDIPTSSLRSELRVSPSRVTLSSKHQIDLGGIGKCLALEEISSWISHQDHESSFLVEAGGDIVGKSSMDFPCWYIAIEDPNTGQPLSFWIRIASGAVATSSPSIRNWTVGSKSKHHLIDPYSMDSSNSDLASVTVVGDTPSNCEVWSKALYLMGKDAALKAAHERSIAAILIDRQSNVSTSASFNRFIEVRGESISAANSASHLDFSSPLINFTFVHFVH